MKNPFIWIKKEKPNPLDEILLWETLALEMSSGVPILQALRILEGAVPAYGNEIHAVHDAIKEGENMSPQVEKSGRFHPLASPLIMVGEETGELPETLYDIATMLRTERDLGYNPRSPNRTEVRRAMFYTHLGALMERGMPLVRGIGYLKSVDCLVQPKEADTLVESVLTGATFAEAIAAMPQHFSKLEVNLIKAGEVGGVIDVVLQRTAGYFKDRLDYSN